MNDSNDSKKPHVPGLHLDQKLSDLNTPDGTKVGEVYAAHCAVHCPAAEANARAETDKHGPSKVNSPAYRDNYDAVFGSRPRGQA